MLQGYRWGAPTDVWLQLLDRAIQDFECPECGRHAALDGLSLQLQENREEIDDLKGQVSDQQKQLSVQQQQLSDKEQQLSAQQKQLSEQQALIAEQRQQLAAQQEVIADLQRQLAEQRQHLSAQQQGGLSDDLHTQLQGLQLRHAQDDPPNEALCGDPVERSDEVVDCSEDGDGEDVC
jgi:septal ring factor EnvC (AmiA/AmiB activator)